MRWRAWVLLCAATAVGLLAAAPARAANSSVSIVDYNFQPSTVTVSVGDTVTWTNTGSATHTVSAIGGPFNSGDLSPGQKFTYTFGQAGTFNYQCNIHTFMKGQVTVVGSGPAPTQPPAPALAPAPSPSAQPATAAAPAATAPRATVAPTTAATTTSTTSSTTTTIAPPAAADAGTTSSTTAAVGGGVALPAEKTSSGGGDDLSPWLIALAVVLVAGATLGGVLLRRRATPS